MIFPEKLLSTSIKKILIFVNIPTGVDRNVALLENKSGVVLYLTKCLLLPNDIVLF